MEPIHNYYVAVDTFFLMGGCLLGFIAFKELDALKAKHASGKITNKSWVKHWGMFYIHRYIRYDMLTSLCWVLFARLGYGNWKVI